VHIGDSRAYLLRDGSLFQITHDHTLVQSLVDEGRISPDEAASHPQRSLLLRALDGRGEVDPDLSLREAQVGDRYLLCSDGLSGVVTAETIFQVLTDVDDPEEVVRQLIDLANRGGGPDNITCVVADVIEIDDPEPPQTKAAIVGAAGSGRLEALSRDLGLGNRSAVTAPQPVITDEDLDDAPAGRAGRRARGRRTWLRVLGGITVTAAALGAGGYGAQQWINSQYYVGAQGDRLVVYQGIDAELGPLSFKKVAYTENVRLSSLPAVQQSPSRSGIQAEDLQDGIETLNRFAASAQPSTETIDTLSSPSGSGQ